MLIDRYINLGFQLSRMNGLQLLKFRKRIIFILGENVNIHNRLIQQLCDAYLNSLNIPVQMVPAKAVPISYV